MPTNDNKPSNIFLDGGIYDREEANRAKEFIENLGVIPLKKLGEEVEKDGACVVDFSKMVKSEFFTEEAVFRHIDKALVEAGAPLYVGKSGHLHIHPSYEGTVDTDDEKFTKTFRWRRKNEHN